MKVIVTDKLITRGQSLRGGWSKAQFAILGFDWPPKPGWRRMAIGREIDEDKAAEFVRLGGRTPVP